MIKKKIRKKTRTRTKIKKRSSKGFFAKDLAAIAAEAAEDKKALEIKILDVKKITSLTDFMVVCTTESPPQTMAISDHIEEKARAKGIKFLKREGEPSSNWMILDFGMVIVHIMGKEERGRYKLEDLWGKKGITYHM